MGLTERKAAGRLQVNINIKMHNISKLCLLSELPAKVRAGSSRANSTIDVQGMPIEIDSSRLHRDPMTPRLTIRQSPMLQQQQYQPSYSPQSAFIAHRCRCG